MAQREDEETKWEEIHNSVNFYRLDHTTREQRNTKLTARADADGRMIGLYTSQVDAWQAAKPIGAVMWRCSPNSDRCVAIQRAMTPERRGAPVAAGGARVADVPAVPVAQCVCD